MKVLFTFLLAIISICTEGFSKEELIKCTDVVLKQIYPNQNACVLQGEIPKKLQGLPFITYPIEISKYNIDRFNFNKRFNIFPKAIIAPKSSHTLAKILRYLEKKHLTFSIRSGGHCFEPGSLSQDYIIDLRHFDSIKIAKNKVYIGAGARLGPVIHALGKHDLALPTGTCQSVGMGGLTLGGGIGFLARTFGLTCDALKSVTFLTADGNIIEVNKHHHPDLFWALRGAGNGSYGIALGFTFEAFDVPKVHFLKLKWEWDPFLVNQIFDAWHAWIRDLPDNINPIITLEYSGGKLSILLEALKVGGESFKEWEKPFWKLKPKVEVFRKGSYAHLAQLWADSPTTPFQKVKSLMAFQQIPKKAIKKTIEYFENLHHTHAPFDVGFEFAALGGKYAQGHTAFFPRKATEWWHQVVNWNFQEDEAAALASIRGFYASVVPLVSEFCYSNDVDYDLGDHYLEAYYGDHVQRLRRIKRAYDPKNIFHWQQSIPP